MARPTFQYGATTITFYKGEIYPNTEDSEPVQSVGYLSSGKVKVATYADPNRMFRFSYVIWRPGISGTSSLSDLRDFIENKIEFTGNAFTYTNSRGEAKTVRLLKPVSYPEDSYESIRGTLLLLEEK